MILVVLVVVLFLGDCGSFFGLGIFLSLFSLTVLLRVSSISILGSVVHEGLDGAAVELLDLEKV